MPAIDRRTVLTGLVFSLGATCFAAIPAADDIVVFALNRETVESVELGAEEPDQKLTIVTVRLTQRGTAKLIRLTTDHVGKGLVIALPDGRQFGPNRIEEPASGGKLGLVLPSDAAHGLAAALNRV